jgi:predicted transcriptional regulator
MSAPLTRNEDVAKNVAGTMRSLRARGATQQEIADITGFSEVTVRRHTVGVVRGSESMELYTRRPFAPRKERFTARQIEIAMNVLAAKS